MKKIFFFLCAFCLLINSLAFAAQPIRLFAAAGLKKPLDTLISEFIKESGIAIEVNYGASGGLYSQILVGQPCDLYFSADWLYIEKLEAEKLLLQSKKLLTDNLVLIVAPSSTEKVNSFHDLTKKDVTLAIADKRAPAGAYSMKGLAAMGILKEVEPQIKAMPATVNQVAITIQEDQLDAGIVYSSVAKVFSLQAVDLMNQNLTGEIVFGLGVLSSDKQNEITSFITFLEKNIIEFEKYGWKAYD